MKQFEALQFPELMAMRRRARRREMATMAVIAAALLMFIAAAIAIIELAPIVLELIQRWALSFFPAMMPASDAIDCCRSLLP